MHARVKGKFMRVTLTRGFAVTILVLIFSFGARAERPQIGAQIWIEPGQTPAQIDEWFHDLAKMDMPVARLFLMWSYLEPSPGKWDFTLYDEAFRAAEKYHVRVVATLTPSGPPPFLGGNGTQGGGVLPTAESRQAAAAYIARVVAHYRTSPALDTWLLVNEPGQPPTDNPAALAAFRKWLTQQYVSIDAVNQTWGKYYKSFDDIAAPQSGGEWNRNPQLDWTTFWEQYQTTQLEWLAEQVKDVDKAHPLHVNPAGLLNNLAGLSDNFPAWRSFLNTLGCSIHPGWHFGILDRDQFALGVSYVNDLVRGSIEPKPYWVTELQGGTNTYSASRPMEPTADDTAQWMWTSVASGADRVIFWLLNARREGVESGEWSLLDFQGKPSERLTTASAIARIIDAHQNFFAGARAYPLPVTVILSLETMTFEEAYHDPEDPARARNAHNLEVMGFYEALSEAGPPPAIKYFDDYDWSTKTKAPRVAILPDARELTKAQIEALGAFVRNGNTLLVSGLTGFYGPHALAWPLAGDPLSAITGGHFKEVHMRGVSPLVDLNAPAGTSLPSRYWITSILPDSARPIGEQAGEIIATERTVPGGGRVIWIPSPIGIGAWTVNPKPLAQYLQTTLSGAIAAEPFTFPEPQKGCLARVLQNGSAYLTVVTNGTSDPIQCQVNVPAGYHPANLWGPAAQQSGSRAVFALPSRGTSVALWK